MSKKCSTCNGDGEILIQHQLLEPSRQICPDCKGLGVPLRTILEEQFEESSMADGTIIYKGEDRYIDFEEEDYDV